MPRSALSARVDTAGVWLANLLRWGRPALRSVASKGAAMMRAGVRGTIEHRRDVAAAGHRIAWWLALALLVVGGRAILGLDAVPGRVAALAPFAAGLGLCAWLRVANAPARLRIAALGLGAVHGLAAVLVWTAFAG